MIKILKIRLFSHLGSSKLTITIILSVLLCFFLSLPLSIYLKPEPILLYLFYPFNILMIFFLLNKHSLRRYQLESQVEELQEKINLVRDENLRVHEGNAALEVKITRYSELKDAVEKLNAQLNLNYVADKLISIAFSLISNNKGVSILYLIDKQLNLQIFKTKKEDEKLIIKAKTGDIFDFWVLRHTVPMLVEDIRKDFRFDTSASLSINGERSRTIDLEKLKSQDKRLFLSLISSPLISEHRFLGTIRLDNPQPNFYSQDDLRFLVTISDLGAVALENSELFERIKDLAIHDGLTLLYTKGYFLDRLKEECARGISLKTTFSLLMLDIDLFKNYNDKFGHSAGDMVLKKLSRDITEFLKGINCVVSRFGGEEFCVILLDIDKKRALSIADKLRQDVEKERLILRKKETNITVSIGIATFPADSMSYDELIQRADQAMYRAKLKGRNQVCSF